jgi:pimeloyl-ACP methyl ester carboxylesterase
MRTVTSKDGTQIAYDTLGEGPPLILVSGASVARSASLPFAQGLAKHFTVYNYDRRGRGDSTDTQPFAIEREIEDIEALIDAAGGSANLFGISSAGALAMEAAIELPDKVKKVAMYEIPYNDDESAQEVWREYRRRLREAIAAGRPGDAMDLFLKLVGVPAEQVQGMHQHPMWPMWEAVAPTLEYDAAVLGENSTVPAERAAQVKVPTLVMDGGASYPFMHVSALALARAIPNAQHRTLQNQTHDVSPEVLAPVLVEFFSG